MSLNGAARPPAPGRRKFRQSAGSKPAPPHSAQSGQNLAQPDREADAVQGPRPKGHQTMIDADSIDAFQAGLPRIGPGSLKLTRGRRPS